MGLWDKLQSTARGLQRPSVGKYTERASVALHKGAEEVRGVAADVKAVVEKQDNTEALKKVKKEAARATKDAAKDAAQWVKRKGWVSASVFSGKLRHTAQNTAQWASQKGRVSAKMASDSLAGNKSTGKITRESIASLKQASVEAAADSTSQARALLRKGGLYFLGVACASAFAYGLGSAIPKIGLEIYRERNGRNSNTDVSSGHTSTREADV